MYKYLISILLVFTACSSTKNTSVPINNKVSEIIWGSGGGFSGQYNTYTLQRSGEISHNVTSHFAGMSKNFGVVKTLRKPLTDSLFQEVLQTNIKTISLHEPGNMNYFLKINEEGKVFEATWSTKSPAEIEKFYNKLNELIDNNGK